MHFFHVITKLKFTRDLDYKITFCHGSGLFCFLLSLLFQGGYGDPTLNFSYVLTLWRLNPLNGVTPGGRRALCLTPTLHPVRIRYAFVNVAPLHGFLESEATLRHPCGS